MRLAMTFAIAGALAAIGGPSAGGAFVTPRAAAAAQAAPRPARALFERAEIKFNLGKFADALSDYQAAYEIEPLPGFLFNIGQCYRNMGDYERARFFFQRYVTLAPRSPNRRAAESLADEMARLAEQRRAGAGSRPPQLALGLAPATPLANGDKPVVLALARARAASSATQAAPLTGAAATTSAGAPDAPPDRASRPLYRRWWFWTGVAGVVVGGSIAAYVATRDPHQGTLPPIGGP